MARNPNRLPSAGSNASPPITSRTSATALPKSRKSNGKRIACVGAGPASLTVARDLAPLGYQVTVFDGDPKAGGFMRTQVPRFRLPESVIDEETGYILDLGVEFLGGRRIDSMKALLDDGYDAIFVGCGAPRGRDLDLPGRWDAKDNIHIGIDWLSSVSFGHIDKIGTPGDRARRRQHRHGLLSQLAPPWRRRRQGDRALGLRRDEGLARGKKKTPSTRASRSSTTWCPRASSTVTASWSACCSRRSRPSATKRAGAAWCRPASRTSSWNATMC